MRDYNSAESVIFLSKNCPKLQDDVHIYKVFFCWHLLHFRMIRHFRFLICNFAQRRSEWSCFCFPQLYTVYICFGYLKGKEWSLKREWESEEKRLCVWCENRREKMRLSFTRSTRFTTNVRLIYDSWVEKEATPTNYTPYIYIL